MFESILYSLYLVGTHAFVNLVNVALGKNRIALFSAFKATIHLWALSTKIKRTMPVIDIWELEPLLGIAASRDPALRFAVTVESGLFCSHYHVVWVFFGLSNSI